jgi:hypothetical protein
MNEIRNVPLRNALEELARGGLAELEAYFASLKTWTPGTAASKGDRRTSWPGLIPPLSHIQTMPAWATCRDLMSSDTLIVSHFNQLVGGVGAFAGRIGDAETCIGQFLLRLRASAPEYDPSVFAQHYAKFEELFYSDTMYFRDWTRLHNFETDVDVILLNDDLRIVRDDAEASQVSGRGWLQSGPISQFTASNYIIEYQYSRPKTVGEGTAGLANNPAKYPTSEEFFDRVITSLRILKHSGVFRDQWAETEAITFHPQGGYGASWTSRHGIAEGEKCVLSTSESQELQRIYNSKAYKDRRFSVAARRLSLGMERHSFEDSKRSGRLSGWGCG